MTSLIASAVTLGAIVAGTAVGMFLAKVLPDHHLKKSTEDTIKLASGMLATLAALVLGLLVASAKQSYDATSTQITQTGAKIALLDNLLAHYGPDANQTRQDLHDALAAGIARVWPEENSKVSGEAALEQSRGFIKIQNELFALAPSTDPQRSILAQAQQVCNELVQSRWLVIEQAQAALPLPLFFMLVSWLTVLFTGIGLFVPRNATALIAVALAGLSFSQAIFLIIELDRPLDGLMKVSSAPLVKVLENLDR